MTAGSNGSPTALPKKRPKSVFGKVVLFLLLGGAAALAYYAYSVGMDRAQLSLDPALRYFRESSRIGRSPANRGAQRYRSGMVS